MKLITRDTDYAIRAICYIARQKQRIVTVAELVKELRIPYPFLRKILQALNKRKILRSYKGRGGGFELSVVSNKIFLVDLMEVFQGTLTLNECFLKRLACPNIKICPLRKKLKNIESYVFKQLRSITIASLLKI
ncbi:MAG: Rrf2 family transcriptional regulator [Candidatus Omnitrophota bacterium]